MLEDNKDKQAGKAGSTQTKYTRRGNETQVQQIRVELQQSAQLRTRGQKVKTPKTRDEGKCF